MLKITNAKKKIKAGNQFLGEKYASEYLIKHIQIY